MGSAATQGALRLLGLVPTWDAARLRIEGCAPLRSSVAPASRYAQLKIQISSHNQLAL